MLDLPILRWGAPYTSLDVDEVVHFATGEPLARVSQSNPGLLTRAMRRDYATGALGPGRWSQPHASDASEGRPDGASRGHRHPARPRRMSPSTTPGSPGGLP